MPPGCPDSSSGALPTERALPIRRFFSLPGKRSYEDSRWSSTVRIHLLFESLMERESLLAADFDAHGAAGGAVVAARISYATSRTEMSSCPGPDSPRKSENCWHKPRSRMPTKPGTDTAAKDDSSDHQPHPKTAPPETRQVQLMRYNRPLLHVVEADPERNSRR